MAKSKLEKIATIDEEIRQLENRRKLLIQQQKKQAQKERVHRFCKRGGLMEKLLPELSKLTDEQFQTFVDKVLLTPYTNRILAGLVPQDSENTTPAEGQTSRITG